MRRVWLSGEGILVGTILLVDFSRFGGVGVSSMSELANSWGKSMVSVSFVKNGFSEGMATGGTAGS